MPVVAELIQVGLQDGVGRATKENTLSKANAANREVEASAMV